MSSPPSPRPDDAASWRTPADGTPADGRRRHRTAMRESWRVSPEAVNSGSSLWRLLSRLGLSAVLVALVVTLVWLLLSLKRDVPVVAYFAKLYEPPLVPIRLVFEDAALLSRLSRSDGSLFRSRSIALEELGGNFTVATVDQLVKAIAERLAKVKPGGPDKDAVILYLAMLGGIDTEGRACLIPPGVSGTESSLAEGSSIAVERLLKTARAALPEKVKLLVVLDACHGGLQWPLGLVDGSFAPAVEAAVDAADLPRTWVLVPASVGQSSQAELPDGASVFARFFAAGLRGAADAARTGDRDGAVELGELVAYLTERVDHWSMSRHGARQTPVIYPPIDRPGRVGDQKLARVENWDAEREIAAALASARARTTGGSGLSASEADPWLRENWATADALGRVAAHDRPLLWQRYQQLLLRAELLYRAGPGHARELRRTATLVERLEMDLVSHYPSALRSAFGDPLFAERLESEPIANSMPNVEYLPILRIARATRRSATRLPAAQSEVREALVAYVTKPMPDQTAPPPTGSAIEWSQRATIAWDWLMESIDAGSEIDRPFLGRWLEFIGPVPDSIPAEPSQLTATRALVRDGSDEAWRAAPRLPGLLLKSLEAADRCRYPADVRADRIVTVLEPTSEAEDQRRLAFDLFFLGDTPSLERAETLARAATERLESAARVGDAISDLYASSDRLLEEMPWLTAWWSAEARANRMSTLGNDGLSNETVPLDLDWSAVVESLTQFTAMIASLAEDAGGGAGNAAGFLERTALRHEAVERAVQPLRDAFRSSVDRLAASAPDSVDTMARIRRMLATPLVRGEARMRLWKRERELTYRFSETLPTTTIDQQSLPATSIDTVVSTWMSLRGLFVQPLVPVLAATASALPSKPVRAEDFTKACGKQVADVLGGIDGVLRAASAEAVATAATRLASLEREEVTSRTLAPVACNRVGLAISPHVRLRVINWHDRFLAAAHDVLEDFWAGSPVEDSAGDDSAPWCWTAAQVLLDKASETVVSWPIDHGRVQRQAIASRLENLAMPGRPGVDPGFFGAIDLEPRTIPVFRAEAGDLPMNTVTLAPRNGVPAGIATAWFAESLRGMPLPIAALDGSAPRTRLPLEVLRNGQKSRLSSWQIDADAIDSLGTRAADLRDGGRVLDLIVWFRGHRLVVAAPLAPASSLRVMEWDAPRMPPPRVAVRGDVPRHQKVAVIFDCSGSMGQRLPDGRTRLEAGRMALYEVLEQIAVEGGWTASVWLYGHRTQWSRDRRGRYTAGLTKAGTRDRDQKTAGGDGSYSLLPGNDVEQVLEPQPLVPLQVTRIRGIIDALEPGGETPLYLALNEALRVDFADEDAGPGHVLVVTDGGNDQSGGRITSSADVLRTLARLNVRRPPRDRVRIDVIGFDLLQGVFDRELRLQDLQSLARDSEGVYYDATDARRLSAALRSSLQVARWGVEGLVPPRDTVMVGEAIPLPSPVEGTTDTYDVTLDSAAAPPRRRVSVMGGEALELFVGGRGRQLQFRRYDGGTEQGIRDAAAGLPDPAGPERTWFVAAHMARRDGPAVTFPVSIQNGVADGFSPRPAELWAVVQPTGPDGHVGLPYVFFDLAFQPLRPVPVIDLKANDWPQQATAAEIRAWFRFGPAEQEVAMPIGEFLPAIERTIPLANMPGSSLRVLVRPIESLTTLRMTVIEDHPPALAPLLPLLRVHVGPGCRRAVHLLAPGGSRVRHEFTLSMLDGQLPPDVMLTVTRSETIKRGAVGPTTIGGSPKTLVVPVPTR